MNVLSLLCLRKCYLFKTLIFKMLNFVEERWAEWDLKL